MQTIYRADAGRITIAEAKRLIIEKLEHGPAIDFFVSDDGSIEVKQNPSANVLENPLHHTFAEVCKSIGIAPRDKYNLARQDYKGSLAEDQMYVLLHAEFVRFAELNGIAVIVGQEPAAKELPSPEPAESEPAKPQDWPLVPPERFQGYNKALYDTMRAIRLAGLPRPTARDILERWASERPDGITWVGDGEFKYLNDSGQTKLSALKSLTQAIARLSPK